MDNKILGMLRVVRAEMVDENARDGSRELSVAITHLETALLWWGEGLRLSTPPINEKAPD